MKDKVLKSFRCYSLYGTTKSSKYIIEEASRRVDERLIKDKFLKVKGGI